jgi:hypothetical protein
MRLIDADVLKQHIDKLPALPDGNFAGNHSALKALINMQPTIESSTNCSEIQNSSDCISRQAAIDATWFEPSYTDPLNVLTEVRDRLKALPSAQPERTCVNCGRTVNNGGWYADGRTRCPIEEHYALPKDGYCHLWEKRNVTVDDYPERRTDDIPIEYFESGGK